jgi:ribosomal protein S4E
MFTLVQFVLLDSAGAIGIKRLKDCLPLIYIIKELLELVQIDRTGRILVKQI